MAVLWVPPAGAIERLWKQLDPPRRDELARGAHVPGTNLSHYNKAYEKRPLSMEIAERIIAAVPGSSLADLE